MIDYYKELNEAIGDLQTVKIVDHHNITGHRVKDADEAEDESEKARLETEMHVFEVQLAKLRS